MGVRISAGRSKTKNQNIKKKRVTGWGEKKERVLCEVPGTNRLTSSEVESSVLQHLAAVSELFRFVSSYYRD